MIGAGGYAAAEAANAVGRLRQVRVDEITSPDSLRDLDKLFTRTDARVATIIEKGVAERLYFVSINAPRIVGTPDRMVGSVRERYARITAPVRTDLLRVVRRALRPALPAPPASKVWQQSRVDLREAMDHRPEQRRSPPG